MSRSAYSRWSRLLAMARNVSILAVHCDET
jgi:hypothetical protein